MGRTAKLQKIEDEERESKFGYVYAVSGPGKYNFINFNTFPPILLCKILLITTSCWMLFFLMFSPDYDLLSHNFIS